MTEKTRNDTGSRRQSTTNAATPPAETRATSAAGGIDLADVMPLIRGLMRAYSEMTRDQLVLELTEALHNNRSDHQTPDAVAGLIWLAEQHGILKQDTDDVFEIRCRSIADYSDAHLRSIAARAGTNGGPTGSESHVRTIARLLGFTRTSKQVRVRIADALQSETTTPTG